MRYFVESYGCTMNYGEGDQIADSLRGLGHSPSASVNDADLVILNTCTVVDVTERRMIDRISELKKMNKEIIVTGCMAKVQPQRISIRLPNSLIIPPGSYDSLPGMVSGRYGIGGSSDDRGYATGTNLDIGAASIIPIAQGCLGDCTYCITKFARGRLTSYPAADILKQFKDALERGCREILITAQDTACYGLDIGSTLPKLIRELLSAEGEYRIRIGMMNPENLGPIVDDLMDVMRDPRVYKFIHVPVQSGSDAVLKRMGRRYTVSEFIGMTEKMRSFRDDMTISTDMITGFPGETDEDHGKSVGLIRTISPDIVNVTRFSARPGTEAMLMGGQIHGRVSKERSRELTALRHDEADDRNRKLIGRTLRVLVTERGKNGTMIARTDDYRQVIVPDDTKLGAFVDTEITDCVSTHLFGRVRRP
ncbi:MAG: tRNA (N(6)-L-threonylcarbamoyladenosine(37)-C(2))-methylthiotransferase [Methanomassiliicoccaceae archaeon]|jgi:MiaB-like tRNA modifying enzyme|nr:tRNA (N(6)-L-threonylcarbamoyladenosine(37)-C(2))-methylthiotransferase [Methanomassiliicoccaceae archaeon]